MTPEKVIEQAQLMMRWAEGMKAGKPIILQCRAENVCRWEDLACDPVWNIRDYEYREKPPEPEEWWCVRYSDGSIASFKNKEDAEKYCFPSQRVVRVLEVLENS